MVLVRRISIKISKQDMWKSWLLKVNLEMDQWSFLDFFYIKLIEICFHFILSTTDNNCQLNLIEILLNSTSPLESPVSNRLQIAILPSYSVRTVRELSKLNSIFLRSISTTCHQFAIFLLFIQFYSPPTTQRWKSLRMSVYIQTILWAKCEIKIERVSIFKKEGES